MTNTATSSNLRFQIERQATCFTLDYCIYGLLITSERRRNYSKRGDNYFHSPLTVLGCLLFFLVILSYF